jgi:hypothetical protein
MSAAGSGPLPLAVPVAAAAQPSRSCRYAVSPNVPGYQSYTPG